MLPPVIVLALYSQLKSLSVIADPEIETRS
jgi:hypothetical protein